MAQSNQKAVSKWEPALAPNLALKDSDRAQLVRSDDQARLLLFRQTYQKALTDPEWELLNAEASARGLSVLHKEIAAIKFGSQLAIFPTINGYYALAYATGQLDGVQTYWSADGIHWAEAWIHEGPPAAAKCELWLKGRNRPIVGVVTFAERKRMYTPSRWDDNRKERIPTGEPQLMEQWRDQPARMLGKCAEALALRMSGLVGSIADESIFADPYEDPNAARAFASIVDESPAPDTRSAANRNAHRAAGAAIGPGGDAHRLVRETVLTANPDLESTAEASPEELNAAAALIDLAGEQAPDSIDVDSVVIDPETGEIEMGPRDEWAATVNAVLEAQQTTESLEELRGAANGESWKWAAMIRHPRLSGALADRYLTLGVKACGESSRELLTSALESRAAARSVEGAAGARKTEAAQASMAGIAGGRDRTR